SANRSFPSRLALIFPDRSKMVGRLAARGADALLNPFTVASLLGVEAEAVKRVGTSAKIDKLLFSRIIIKPELIAPLQLGSQRSSGSARFCISLNYVNSSGIDHLLGPLLMPGVLKRTKTRRHVQASHRFAALVKGQKAECARYRHAWST